MPAQLRSQLLLGAMGWEWQGKGYGYTKGPQAWEHPWLDAFIRHMKLFCQEPDDWGFSSLSKVAFWVSSEVQRLDRQWQLGSGLLGC